MKWTFWFVTYNGMGGHPVLSFGPDVLWGADPNLFGSAVVEIEICAHVEPERGPPLGSDLMMARFQARLPTLPKAWFRRKKKRVEIAYHSHLGNAENILGGDFTAKRVPDASLLRRTCDEAAASLALLKTCIKKSDDFDVGGFLGCVEAKVRGMNSLDEDELMRRLKEAQARAQAARAS